MFKHRMIRNADRGIPADPSHATSNQVSDIRTRWDFAIRQILTYHSRRSGGFVDVSPEQTNCVTTDVVTDTHDADGDSRHDHSCSTNEQAGELCRFHT